MISVAFAQLKGGSGKTTTCINVAGWLERMGKRVLVIDLDPQTNATGGLGISPEQVRLSVHDVLRNNVPLKKIIVKSSSGVYVAPGSYDLLVLEASAVSALALKQQVASVSRYFDCVLFDLPHMSWPLMTVGILAAHNVVVPMEAGVFAIENLELLARWLGDVANQFNVTLAIPAVLILEYPKQQMFYRNYTRQTKKMVTAWLGRHFDQAPKVIVIPYSGMIYQVQAAGMPVSHVSGRSSLAQAYRKVATMLVDEQ